MNETETLNALTLAAAAHFNPDMAVQLYRAAGSATAVIDNRRNIGDIIPGCSRRMTEALADVEAARSRAEGEVEYALRTGTEILCMGDEAYPWRLKDCPDAPLALFFRGTGPLNRRRIISIVGTRRCTAYGQD